MSVVRARYESSGWTVEDVSNHRPYDLVCHRGTAHLHVEVKGLSGLPTRVHLTANEVEHARSCPHAVLAVVSGIEITQSTPPGTAGGSLDVYDPWRVEDEHLRATEYSYSLTRETQPLDCPACGSGRTAPLFLGLPDLEAEELGRRGEVFFGGDVLLPELIEADRGCLTCRHIWRSPYG